jgi:hypothetical protein
MVNEPAVLPKPLEKLEADLICALVSAVTPLVPVLLLPTPPVVADREGLFVLFQ